MIVRLDLVLLFWLLAIVSLGCSGLSLRRIRSLLQHGVLLFVVALASMVLSGCSGLVSGASTTGNPPPSALNITNVQATSNTTSSSQIVWTTNVAADSALDYGTSASYGSSTPVDPAMITSHQVTLSGLAAGATYYYQVNSTDSKGNHARSGGYSFKTSGFSISGTISPPTGGSGAMLTLGGAASTTTTADGVGNYTFAGLANGTYTIAPSHAGYTFTPNNQSATVNGANVTAVNFTDNAAPVAPTITTQPGNQTVTAGQTASFSVVATGNAPLSYQWNRSGTAISGATSSTYTTSATTSSDNGAQFTVLVSNTVGNVISNAAALTVNAAPVAPSITTQPASQTVTAGQTASFSVVATGNAPLSYQWNRSGTAISGATSSTYTTSATTSSDNGAQFTVLVSNTVGSVISNAATLTVNPAPAPAIQVSPTSISFGNAVVSTSLSQALIITNTGTATLTITQVTASGSATFSVSGFSLPLSVNAGKQTTITVTFLPTSVGPVSGNISIVSNAPTSLTSVGFSGTGIAATLTLGISPASLSFGNVTTGTSSASQNVTITNTGNANVTISQVSVSAGYSVTGGSTPVTVSPAQNLILTAQFSPPSTGPINGNISIASNATGSPASVSLSGTGVAPIQHSVALTWNASTSTVSGYNIYRSTANGSSYILMNASLVAGLSYTDSTVQNTTTYYYVTTAVDNAGMESVYSNQVLAVIP